MVPVEMIPCQSKRDGWRQTTIQLHVKCIENLIINIIRLNVSGVCYSEVRAIHEGEMFSHGDSRTS